jgi:hypothetical protein
VSVVHLLQRLHRFGRQQLAAPAVREEGRAVAAAEQIRPGGRAAVREPAQHAEQRPVHFAALSQEPAERDRDIGGYRRKHVLEGGEQRQHRVDQRRRLASEPVEQRIDHG